ncbi:MAG: penicillin-binding protein 2 [Lachnospiraceae bacterium]|nr:penicillin-binding protein 2 [Lachnospiraceae bacterium]
MKENRSMNSNILKTTYIFMLLFLILAIYLIGYVVVGSEKDINNPYNKRTDLFAEKILRGNIYADDMAILAQTVTDENGKESRVYPYNNLFCHVVGSFDKGKYGLESTFDFQLLETGASISEEILAELNNEKLKGNSIVTTLNIELQNICYEALGDYDGAVMVMDATSGDVLAMVSKPDYNPNDISSIWEDIREDDHGALLNRVAQGLYPPGSVYKLFTLGGYIDQYKGSYYKFMYDCSGSVNFVDFTMGCSNRRAHGQLGLMGAFSNSCNCAFVELGSYMNIDKFREYCEEKLFNSKLPITLPYKSSSLTLSSADSEFIKCQTVIGQGETLVTPIHMCMVMSAIANDGVLMKPRFVTSIIDFKGNTVEEYDTEEYQKLYSKKEATMLKEYLREVVNSGTAYRLKNDAMNVYGKTGTAQINTTGITDSWFVGAVETEDGKVYAVSVVLENVKENTSPSVVVTEEIIKALDK